MGPWLCSHGNSRRWKWYVTNETLASMGPWLCSHGNGCPADWSHPGRFASMGPWLCSHGNEGSTALKVLCRRLQWGRGCVATEIGVTDATRLPPIGFNGAVAV